MTSCPLCNPTESSIQMCKKTHCLAPCPRRFSIRPSISSFFFFFNDAAPTEIYTLSLHDALPIWPVRRPARAGPCSCLAGPGPMATPRPRRPPNCTRMSAVLPPRPPPDHDHRPLACFLRRLAADVLPPWPRRVAGHLQLGGRGRKANGTELAGQLGRHLCGVRAGDDRHGDHPRHVGPCISGHEGGGRHVPDLAGRQDRKSTRLNSSHLVISYAV